MAHRIVFQVIVTGARVVGRAATEAWKQANASQAYAKANGKNPGSAITSSHGLTLDEACKILNVPPPLGGKTDMELVIARFKKLFDLNEPSKGGSFYLQSKILRARERIESEVRKAKESAEWDAEMNKEFKPKLWKQ